MTQPVEPSGPPEVREAGTAGTPPHDRVTSQISPGGPKKAPPKAAKRKS